MQFVRQKDIEKIFKDKKVAVVGNAKTILERSHGIEIDSHDVVIRMNNAMPKSGMEDQLGTKTTIWTQGKEKYFQATEDQWAQLKGVIWMKPKGLTKSGDADWESITKRAEEDWGPYEFGLWRYGRDIEDRVHEYVGHPPSTGIRIIDFIHQYTLATEVSVFGFDFFGARGTYESWYRTPSHRPHQGEKEFDIFRKFGFIEKETGWWTKIV